MNFFAQDQWPVLYFSILSRPYQQYIVRYLCLVFVWFCFLFCFSPGCSDVCKWKGQRFCAHSMTIQEGVCSTVSFWVCHWQHQVRWSNLWLIKMYLTSDSACSESWFLQGFDIESWNGIVTSYYSVMKTTISTRWQKNLWIKNPNKCHSICYQIIPCLKQTLKMVHKLLVIRLPWTYFSPQKARSI